MFDGQKLLFGMLNFTNQGPAVQIPIKLILG